MMNTQEQARVLMIRNQQTQRNRQQSMLERAAAEIRDEANRG
jgi:hypothetical protein